jgi:hypothetical protein
MTRVVSLIAVCGALAQTAPRALPGQAASATLAQGVRAYDDLELDAASGLLRRALAVQGSNALASDERERALMYLVATELLRQNGDSARAVARRLVFADPRFRPDELVFPPEVLQLYADVRRTTPVVTAQAPADTAFRPGSESFAVRLFASTVHDVSATLIALDGRVVRTLYRGPISDSLVLYWNGLDSTGERPPPGDRYAITVSSLDRTARVVRILRLPLEILDHPVETLPYPPPPADSVLRPERHAVGPALRVLAPGVLAGLAIGVVPGLIAEGETPSGGRYVVGGVVIGVSVAAFVSHSPGRAIPANVEHNRTIQEWRRAEADVARRNAELIGVRSGAPVIITPDGGAGGGSGIP